MLFSHLGRSTVACLAVARKSLFRLHNAVGLGVMLFVLTSALTGGVLTFREQLGKPTPTAPIVAEHLPLEQIIARAEAAGDGSPATDIQLALEPEQAYLVWLDDDVETEVYLDGAGNVLETREGRSALTRTLFRIHTGELLGWFGQGLMFTAALGLCLLAWSGFSMWWSRRRPQSG